MKYEELVEAYSLSSESLNQVIEIIDENVKTHHLSFQTISKAITITKSQFFYSLYRYLIDTEYFSKSEPDNELLIKVTNIEKFKEMGLPYEEKREFLGFLILYNNKTLNYTFVDQVLKINSSDYSLDYFQIQHEFSKVLPLMKINNEELIKILNHFYEQASQYMTVGEVFTSCGEFCINNPEQGWDLLEYMINNNESKFLINVILGLSVNDFERVWEYVNKLFETEFQSEAILVYGYINYKNTEQIKESLGKMKNIIENTEKNEILSATAKSLGNIVYHPLIEKDKLESIVFKYINEILLKKIPEVQYNILQSLSIGKGNKKYNEFKKELLLNYYDVNLEHKGIIRNLSYYLHDLKKPEIVLNFVKNWLLNHDRIKDLDDFDYALQDSYQSNPKQYIEEYLKLLIHPKAQVRQVIKTIFEIVRLNSNNKEFWLELIKSLSFRQQKNLFKSLNDYSIDIKEKLSIASLLVKTHDQKVYKFLLQELVWLIHDYGSLISDIVSNTINTKNKMEKEFEIALLKYSNEITTLWKEKSLVKEIDPRLNQTKIFDKFNEIYYKKQNEFFANYETDKTPLLNMITKVQIGRGRTFKMGDNTTPGYMSKFEKSFILPRTLFIFPEYYNYNWNKSQNEDWEDSDA